MAEDCKNAGSLNTSPTNSWTGRSRTHVGALDTWETLYKGTGQIDVDPYTGKYIELPQVTEKAVYIKQIYIHNCSNVEAVPGKAFSVRLYNASAGTYQIIDEDLVFSSEPAECILVNNMLIPNGANIAILTSESPLKLATPEDEIQFQSHTSLDGFSISVWMESWSQYYFERELNPRAKLQYTDPSVGQRTALGQPLMKIGRTVTGTPNKTTQKERDEREKG
jgi:hypothetical protein